MASLPREVLKWIQSLDLTWKINQPKWDLSNAYLIAEIFSWYYPNQIYVYSFNKGSSYEKRSLNWDILKEFFRKQKINIPEQLIDGTIHCKEGAATAILIYIYELLTKRHVHKVINDYPSEFSDTKYQLKLPMHARSTASKSVKNNITTSEILAYQNVFWGQQEVDEFSDTLCPKTKAQHAINRHLEIRKLERIENPKRFGLKPTIGQLAARKSLQPLNNYNSDQVYNQSSNFEMSSSKSNEIRTSAVQKKAETNSKKYRQPAVSFKEHENIHQTQRYEQTSVY